MAASPKKKTEAPADAYKVTLHGCQSYTSGSTKFVRGVARHVTETVMRSLPRDKFIVVELAPPVEVEEVAEDDKKSEVGKKEEGK